MIRGKSNVETIASVIREALRSLDVDEVISVKITKHVFELEVLEVLNEEKGTCAQG